MAAVTILGLGLLLLVPAATPTLALDDVEEGKEATPAAIAARIDAILAEHHAREEITPAPVIDDAGYYRRLSLDLGGVIPRAEEARSFVALDAEEKRSQAVDWMLASPDYAEFQAEYWVTALLGRAPRYPRLRVESLRQWLRRQFEEAVPFDAWVRELITAEGFIEASGPANFYWRYAVQPVEVSSRLSHVFLGVKVHCAQCHDHPYDERLTRDRFWEQAAFFGRMGRVSYRAADEEYHDGLTERAGGELRMPPLEAGQPATPMKPRFLFEAEYPEIGEVNRRQRFAAWLTSGDNDLFTTTVVTRVWAQLTGVELIRGEEGFEFHDEILAILAKDFVASGFDLTRLFRVVTATTCYQRESRGAAETGDVEPEDFARAPLKRLGGEQLARSLLRASGQEEPQPDKNRQRLNRFLDNTFRQYVRSFGQEALAERDDFEGSVPQMLLLFNAGLSNGAGPAQMRRPDPVAENRKTFRGSLAVIMRGKATDDDRIDQLFFWVVGRAPTDEERAGVHEMIPDGKARKPDAVRAAFEDVYWVLINSAEFTFNH